MTRTLVLAAVLTITALTSIVAQEITAEERTACKADYEKYCGAHFPAAAASSPACASITPNLATPAKRSSTPTRSNRRRITLA